MKRRIFAISGPAKRKISRISLDFSKHEGVAHPGVFAISSCGPVDVHHKNKSKSIRLFTKVYGPGKMVQLYPATGALKLSTGSDKKSTERTARHNVAVYEKLRSLGLTVPTTFRMVKLRDAVKTKNLERSSRWAILQTDLSRAGKRIVVPLTRITNLQTGEALLNAYKRITNLDKVCEELNQIAQRAGKERIYLYGSEFMLCIDKNTGETEVVLTDFDETRLNTTPKTEKLIEANNSWRENVKAAQRN
ncbi:MAG TPA: hypothetical protein VI977_04995 [archaeon]|nr:hypothetical protein [archaeon]